jgi:DNA-binding LacI/PurR family transcriptional regulator
MGVSKVTIRDVARLSGFSVSTVSHVINATRFVELETKEKILQAIEFLNYKPNILARSLKGKGTKTIGVIISDIRQGFFAEVIKSIESRANVRGFNVMLCDSEDSAEKEEFYIDILLRKGVDGIIFAPVDTSQLFEELRLSNLHMVQIDRKLPDWPSDFVGIDNVKSAEIATYHLFDMGYQSVGFIGYGPKVYTMARRLEGYMKAVQSRGKTDVSLTMENYNEEYMKESIKGWLRRNPSIDSVLCGNDDICSATLIVLEEMGVRVPSNFGIITFDDSRWFRFLSCPITSIRQPTTEIGKMAVDLLIDRIEGKLQGDYRDVLLETQLVMRKSSMKEGTLLVT